MWGSFEILVFFLLGLCYTPVRINVSLRPVHYTNVSFLQRQCPALENVLKDKMVNYSSCSDLCSVHKYFYAILAY